MKVQGKKYFKRTDLKRDSGNQFVMVFVYLQTGTEVFTGSLNNIEAFLQYGPTCHGEVCAGIGKVFRDAAKMFGKPIGRSVKFSEWRLFGQNNDPLTLIKSEKKWYLTYKQRVNGRTYHHDLGEWRRLPREPMKQLIEFDNGHRPSVG